MLFSILISTLIASPQAQAYGARACSNPLVQSALQILAAQHQSCEVLEPVDFHPDNFRASEHAERSTSCLNRPWVRPIYSQAVREPEFISLGNGRLMMDYYKPGFNANDCSSFVTGAIAGAGWRITQGQDINVGFKTSPNTTTMSSWGASTDCFEPALFTRTGPALLPGDIIVNDSSQVRGHVVLVTSVENPQDPFGLEFAMQEAGIQSPSDCSARKLRPYLPLEVIFDGKTRDLDSGDEVANNTRNSVVRSRITIVDSSNPEEKSDQKDRRQNGMQNGTLHHFYDRRSIVVPDMMPLMVKLCQARAGNTPVYARGGGMSFLRHKNIPSCYASRHAIPRDLDCVQSCNWKSACGE